MNQIGPTRGDLLFRLCFSLSGLGLLIFAFVHERVPRRSAFSEIVLPGCGFFGGTIIWTYLKLGQTRDE